MRRSDTGPFTLIPNWLLDAIAQRSAKSGSTDLRVYCALARRADYDTGQCWPSHARIAEDAGVSPNTVANALHRLRDMGAVAWTPTVTDAGDPGPNNYTIVRTLPTLPGDPSPRQPGDPSPTQVGTNENHIEREPEERSLVHASVNDSFDAWWAMYPRKQGKATALTKWRRLSAEERQACLDAQPAWNAYWARRGEPEFIPMGSTWVNQRRWHDDIPTFAKPRPNTTATRSLDALDRVLGTNGGEPHDQRRNLDLPAGDARQLGPGTG